ncbi:MAG TPA: type II secretion system protein [Nocardioides bacterium]|uniref:type II secretion system F family protein n=1 Tax=uncultured Nocardioides sp. TaxID=198441 RepID=UPI000EC12771|nr:type II secretion system F family protein [uncultured Nocardioides sp.]HCB06774.1 type II secretion system protein [Nocardioides sp.]
MVLSGVLAGVALALLLPGHHRLDPPAAVVAARRSDRDWLRRWRPVWMVSAAVAAALFLGGRAGLVAGLLAATATWLVIERSEPAHVRRDRELAARDLPHVVGLLGDALRAGQAPVDALAVVVAALPGPASERLAETVPRLRLGVHPLQVWSELAADPALGPLGRAMARAHRTGGAVVPTIERLADDLARAARSDVEDRARAVGVKAAVPLGLCLLPAFVLIGIVPVVAGLVTSLGL